MSAEQGPPPVRDIGAVHASAEEMKGRGARLIMIVAREDPGGTFELIYLWDVEGCVQDRRFGLAADQEVDTISDLYAGATNLEREVVDLFGLKFKGIAPGLLLEAGKSPLAPLRRPREGPGKEGKEGTENA